MLDALLTIHWLLAGWVAVISLLAEACCRWRSEVLAAAGDTRRTLLTLLPTFMSRGKCALIARLHKALHS